MKVAQTELTEAEYQLLLHYADRHGITLKQALREATRLLVLSDRVDPDDPIFNLHIVPGTGKKERTSVEHDKLLYGEDSRSS